MFADGVQDLCDVANLTPKLIANTQKHSGLYTNSVLRDTRNSAKDYYRNVLDEISDSCDNASSPDEPPAKRVELEPTSLEPRIHEASDAEIVIEVDSSPEVVENPWQPIFPSMARRPPTPRPGFHSTPLENLDHYGCEFHKVKSCTTWDGTWLLVQQKNFVAWLFFNC